MAKQSGGNPALKNDPTVLKVYRTMRAGVELVDELEGKLTEEQLEWAKSFALGMMLVYSELTGKPSPISKKTLKEVGR